ncbi:hypothetical protein PsorP6_008204 [Peronosclerospora sorghi]|uniref:Uncharacterized protein n=1 Tax=Peronosclerospora sorghi TaxID=230839 RepID=A0ACC0WC02_9STRA|nr:hypothetical protein PsorP6_008204 [Peronosclerospora sorghi]
MTVARAIEAAPPNTCKTYIYRKKAFMNWCNERNFADGHAVDEGKLLLFLTKVVVKKGNKLKSKSNDNGHPVPLSVKCYQTYISTLVQMWNDQISLKMHSNPHPNEIALKSFIKSLKCKETTRRREEFEDRGMNTLPDGYTVKDMMTLQHHYISANSVNQLRNRADLVIVHMMMMRGESPRMLQVVEDIENEGPGACPALLCIMDQGKTN